MLFKTEIPEEGCWEFRGYRAHGYGYLEVDGKAQRAHRVSYRLFIGPIPEGKRVLHRCDNRGCVNPSHLETGTDSDNMRQMVERGRHGNQWRRQLSTTAGMCGLG